MKLDTLYTERLILRQFSKEDLENYTAIMTNPQVTCFLGTGKEKTPEDVRQVLIHFQNCLDKNGFGVWAVVFKESGKLIGHCGFLPLENGEDVELLYAFDPSSWGKKIASEAACICLDYAQKNYHWDFIYALAYPENTASIRVLEKLGFTPDEKVLCFGKLLNHFSYKL